MSWAKLNGGTYLEYHSGNAIPVAPNNYWVQVDVWVPSHAFPPEGVCPPGASNPDSISAYLLSVHQAGFPQIVTDFRFADESPGLPPPAFRWESDQGSGGRLDSSAGPTFATPMTVACHVQCDTAKADWYVDGGHIFAKTALPNTSEPWYWRLGWGSFSCCCEIYYFTNFKVGTSQGADDLFAWDFSGGLHADTGGWTVHNYRFATPAFATVVSSPADDPCPTLTVSPVRGQAETPLHLVGGGFPPNTSLALHIGDVPVGPFDVTSDAGGGFDVTIPLPPMVSATSAPYLLYVDDGDANIACAQFSVCGGKPADGINSDVGAYLSGGTFSATQASDTAHVLDYIFHDGSHWVLWRDPSVFDGEDIFPPPANHSMNVTRLSADGTSIVDYPVDTNYCWEFGSGDVNDPGLSDHWDCGPSSIPASPVWSHKAFFGGWRKPVYDAQFASDGTNLWLSVLTAETIDYPYLDNRDAHATNPGGAAQVVPLATLTSGFTAFATSAGAGYLRYYTNPTGPINIFKNTAYPLTDAGIKGMGVHNPPVVVMFAWDGSGFTRIGEVAAAYCPSVIGHTSGYDSGGSIIGGTDAAWGAPNCPYWATPAIAADPSDPGVCHLVWGEGGDWGRVADGNPCATGPYGGSRYTWDGGPANRDYRINYTTWSPTAKLSDTDLWHDHTDRTNWYFPWDDHFGSRYKHGYAYPYAGPNICGAVFKLRCDSGRPLLFIAFPTAFQNIWERESGDTGPNPPGAVPPSSLGPNLDYSPLYADSLDVYDISGGGSTLLQSIDLASGLFPDEAEAEYFFPPTSPSNSLYAPPFAPDAVYLGPTVGNISAPPVDVGFGISLAYDDPTDPDAPVYLVHVPFTQRWSQETDTGTWDNTVFSFRSFVRVPIDLSVPFDYMDGIRQPGFTIVRVQPGGFGVPQIYALPGVALFSDPRDIWIPAFAGRNNDSHNCVYFTAAPPMWFDRICDNAWENWRFVGNGDFVWPQSDALGAPAFRYDPTGDTITVVVEANPYRGEPSVPWTPTPLFYVETYFICRGCRTCQCGVGVHIVRRA